MYQLAIFDLDGTLINSIEDLADAVNYSLQIMHYPTHPVSSYYYFVGDGVKKLCERALPEGAPPEQADHLLAMFQAYYEEHCMDHTRPYEGISDVLHELKSVGILLAVASNKPQEFTEKIVTHFFGDQCFSKILGGNDIRPKKPSPEILIEILNYFAVPRQDVVMIGDSNVDIQTAQNAGISSIGCTWGFRSREELEVAGAVYLVETPKNLVSIINK